LSSPQTYVKHDEWLVKEYGKMEEGVLLADNILAALVAWARDIFGPGVKIDPLGGRDSG
jgi:hypothetical protein